MPWHLPADVVRIYAWPGRAWYDHEQVRIREWLNNKHEQLGDVLAFVRGRLRRWRIPGDVAEDVWGDFQLTVRVTTDKPAAMPSHISGIYAKKGPEWTTEDRELVREWFDSGRVERVTSGYCDFVRNYDPANKGLMPLDANGERNGHRRVTYDVAPGCFRAYFLKCLKNHCNRWAAGEHPEVWVTPPDDSDRDGSSWFERVLATAGTESGAIELVIAVRECLARLSPLEQELVVWYHVEGLKDDETQNRLRERAVEMAIGAIRVRRHRAMQKLKRLLEQRCLQQDVVPAGQGEAR